MAATRQTVRLLPRCRKVKQFNNIEKHQLTFITCNAMSELLQNTAVFPIRLLMLMNNRSDSVLDWQHTQNQYNTLL